MAFDMVTATSPYRFSIDLVRRSDLIVLQMVNPASYEFITVENLTMPVKVQIPISRKENETVFSLQVNITQAL